MKKLNDLRKQVLNEEIETIEEEVNLPGDPPWMLMFKRTGVRIFPNGKRVAMYSNAKLGITVAIPYNTSGGINHDVDDNIAVAEEVEQIDEATAGLPKPVDHLRTIVDKHQASVLKHKNGTSSHVDAATAKALLTVHDSLSPENQGKFQRLAHGHRDGFKKLVDFAWKNVDIKYSGK